MIKIRPERFRPADFKTAILDQKWYMGQIDRVCFPRVKNEF